MRKSQEYLNQQDLKRRLQEISSRGPNQQVANPLQRLSVQEWKELGLNTTSSFVSFNPLSQDSPRRPSKK